MVNPDILQLLKRIISEIDQGLLIYNRSGEILHASYDLNKLLEEKELIGKSIFEYLDFETTRVRNFLNNLNTSKYFDLSIQLKRGKKSFPARVRMASWRISEEEYVVLASIIDATMIERKRRDLLRKTLTIEQLSRSKKIRSGKLYDAIYEILEMSAKAVKATRVNAWLFDPAREYIEPIGNFDVRVGKMIPQEVLPVIEMPTYFRLFESEKIILANDAQHSRYTSELNEAYLKPNRIVSLMDIPLRSEGQIIGVICFEQVDETRDWTLNDQKFGLIAAQMVSLAVETHKRKKIQQELEAALRQQQRLLTESNHRIASNLEIASKLLQIQVSKAQDSFHKELLVDSVNRIHSIAELHGLLSENMLSSRVSLNHYIQKIVNGLKESISHKNNQLQLLLSCDQCEVHSSIAICIGIIINEAVTNTSKHAYSEGEIGVVRIDFQMNGPRGVLSIMDTGKGLRNVKETFGSGLDIIKGMTEHLNGELEINGENGMKIVVSFLLR